MPNIPVHIMAAHVSRKIKLSSWLAILTLFYSWAFGAPVLSHQLDGNHVTTSMLGSRIPDPLLTALFCKQAAQVFLPLHPPPHHSLRNCLKYRSHSFAPALVVISNSLQHTIGCKGSPFLLHAVHAKSYKTARGHPAPHEDARWSTILSLWSPGGLFSHHYYWC